MLTVSLVLTHPVRRAFPELKNETQNKIFTEPTPFTGILRERKSETQITKGVCKRASFRLPPLKKTAGGGGGRSEKGVPFVGQIRGHPRQDSGKSEIYLTWGGLVYISRKVGENGCLVHFKNKKYNFRFFLCHIFEKMLRLDSVVSL